MLISKNLQAIPHKMITVVRVGRRMELSLIFSIMSQWLSHSRCQWLINEGITHNQCPRIVEKNDGFRHRKCSNCHWLVVYSCFIICICKRGIWADDLSGIFVLQNSCLLCLTWHFPSEKGSHVDTDDMHLFWISVSVRIQKERGSKGRKTVKKQMDVKRIDESE